MDTVTALTNSDNDLQVVLQKEEPSYAPFGPYGHSTFRDENRPVSQVHRCSNCNEIIYTYIIA